MAVDIPLDFKRTGKLQGYVNNVISIIKKQRPDIPENEMKQLVKNITIDRYRQHNPLVRITTAETQGEGMYNKISPISISVADKYILDNNLIVAGSGSLYVQHEGSINIITKMIDFLKTERKRYKKLKFKYMKEGNYALEFINDILQLTIKIFNNSLYGILTQKDSIYYDPLSGPSITLSGQDATTTAVSLVEKFVANNIFFWNLTDAIVYVNNILDEPKTEGLRIKFQQSKSLDNLHEYLCSKFDNYDGVEKDKEFLREFLSKIPESEYNRIYYKNNYDKFIEDSNVMEEYFDKVLGKDDFLDANEPPEYMVEDLNELYKVFKEYVLYNYQDTHRFRNMSHRDNENKRLRKATLVIDTDSTFITCGNTLDVLASRSKTMKDPEDFKERISIINAIMYIMTQAIQDVLYRYCREIGVPHDKCHLLAMKNE